MVLAAARLYDGRQIIVQGVPGTVAPGDEITCTIDAVPMAAVISIPPSLLLYVDPTVPRAHFETLIPVAADPRQAPAPQPIELLRWEAGGPGDEAVAAMLALAEAERGRLDDAGDYPARPESRRR